MDLQLLIGPAVVAAVVGALASIFVGWRRGNVDERLKELDHKLSRELANQKENLEREIHDQRKKFESELAEQKARLDERAAYAAERVAQQLMKDEEWRLRSFEIIKHHLKGFEDNDLRQILVRAGGISFKSRSGKELWGLLERNMERLGVEWIDTEPTYKPANPKGSA